MNTNVHNTKNFSTLYTQIFIYILRKIEERNISKKALNTFSKKDCSTSTFCWVSASIYNHIKHWTFHFLLYTQAENSSIKCFFQCNNNNNKYLNTCCESMYMYMKHIELVRAPSYKNCWMSSINLKNKIKIEKN